MMMSVTSSTSLVGDVISDVTSTPTPTSKSSTDFVYVDYDYEFQTYVDKTPVAPATTAAAVTAVTMVTTVSSTAGTMTARPIGTIPVYLLSRRTDPVSLVTVDQNQTAPPIRASEHTATAPGVPAPASREKNSVDEVQYRVVGADSTTRDQQNLFVPRMLPFHERTQNQRIQQLLKERQLQNLLRLEDRTRARRNLLAQQNQTRARRRD